MEVVNMKIIKIISDLSGEIYRNKKPIIWTPTSYIGESYSYHSMEKFYSTKNYSILNPYIGRVHLIYFSFILEDNSAELRIYHQIPEDLIKYTRCEYVRSISDVEIEKDNGGYCVCTNKPLIRLTFDGPDELALVWKLSI